MDAADLNEIKQYRPAFMDFDEELEIVSFATLEELTAIPWVKTFTEFPVRDQPFHRFSMSEYGDAHMLLAEYDDGYIWLVVGFLRDKVEGLPRWAARYREKNGHAFVKPIDRNGG